MQKLIIASALVLTASLTSGCLVEGGGSSAGADSSDPEAYVYKGRPDPLLSVPGSDRADALKERFMQIQGRQ